MVGIPFAFKGSAPFAGQGFTVDFETPSPGPIEILTRDAVIVRGASVEAVHMATEDIKEQIRDYIDAHFSGSEFHGNGRRRVSNASAQSTYYDEVAEKGQYAGLVYSKFGKRDRGGFVDFLLLHVRGGTIKPDNGNWLRITASGRGRGPNPQTGFFNLSGSDIFFAPSKDGKTLFQLRRKRGKGDARKRTELLATLVREVTIPSRLTGIDAIARKRPELFEKYFLAALGRGEQGSAA